MKGIDFFSSGKYLYLPSKFDPKVILAVNDPITARNSFKLYNPFSKKAKLLKRISSFLVLNTNRISERIFSISNESKSDFIQYLEDKLKITIRTSLYFSTAKDKVVLQLQSDFEIVGYLKFPMNEKGVKRLLNEKKAIEILSKKNIVDSPILFDYYKSQPYLLLKELKGEINELTIGELKSLLGKLKKNQTFRLFEHPRVKQLITDLDEIGFQEYKVMLNEVCIASKKKYLHVYEHGDFTPWNIIKSSNDYVPFDMEYFEENGLEYMDLIKYFYQVGRLLRNYSKIKLFKFICRKIKIDEIDLLIKLFLIKEILQKKIEKESYQFEKEMLKIMYFEKT